MCLMVYCQLRTLSIAFAAAGEVTSIGLFIGVDVTMFPHALLVREALVAVGTEEIADIEVSSADMTLEVELRIIALRAIRIETGELVSFHFTSHVGMISLSKGCSKSPLVNVLVSEAERGL